MVESIGSVSRAMTGASRPRRFKLSLPFLNRKKKRKNSKDNDVPTTPGPDDESAHPAEEGGIGDILQDIEEENEEQLHETGRDVADGSGDKNLARDHEHHRRADNYEEPNLTLALVPKLLSPLDLPRDSTLLQPQMSYKSFDIAYPPGGSPPSRRRTERSSSMKAFDASTRSGSLRTESTSTQISVPVRKGWLSTRCGFGSCTKQIDLESERRARDRAAHRERHRSHHSRSKATDPKGWDRDNMSEWSVMAEVDREVGRKQLAPRKRKGYKKSSKLAPSPGIFPTDGVLALTPDMKCSLRDPYEEVREAAKYDLPSQRASSEVEQSGVSGRSHVLHTLTDGDGNTAEEADQPWERSYSSSSSDDDELFTTSLEQDGQSKPRRKKWSSNSSDETEVRNRRASAGGSHSRSKSTWSTHSLRGDVVQEHEIVESEKTGGKKGSRIIFLSTPPRLKDEEMDEDDEPASTEQSLLKTSSDRFGEYSKLEPVDHDQPRFERTYSMGYKSSLPASSFEAEMEATAKAWSKLEARNNNRVDESLSDASIRELPMVSRLKESGQNRLRQIDVQIEDHLVNLRLESDVSESSEGKAYTSLRGSRRLIDKALSKSGDQDKVSKKKRGAHSRRRRGRKAKAPPPLPTDLHGKVKESVAVVKSSYDPYTDFRDSMVEMIVEKEIQGATDLEELLRCYLSLNSAEYHSVIVKVFADVWRELFADAI
ncbi:unnamed protein product [Calypogeia fissa]